MYIVPIGWIYVAFMMSVAEATNANGSVLGAIVTFVLYGVLPVALIMYFMATPGRKRAIRAREAQEHAAFLAAQAQHDPAISDSSPDTGRHAPANAVAPVREIP